MCSIILEHCSVSPLYYFSLPPCFLLPVAKSDYSRNKVIFHSPWRQEWHYVLFRAVCVRCRYFYDQRRIKANTHHLHSSRQLSGGHNGCGLWPCYCTDMVIINYKKDVHTHTHRHAGISHCLRPHGNSTPTSTSPCSVIRGNLGPVARRAHESHSIYVIISRLCPHFCDTFGRWQNTTAWLQTISRPTGGRWPLCPRLHGDPWRRRRGGRGSEAERVAFQSEDRRRAPWTRRWNPKSLIDR